jgi:hypothetical protein
MKILLVTVALRVEMMNTSARSQKRKKPIVNIVMRKPDIGFRKIRSFVMYVIMRTQESKVPAILKALQLNAKPRNRRAFHCVRNAKRGALQISIKRYSMNR